MTKNRVREILAHYQEVLSGKGYVSIRDFSHPNGDHLFWMCEQAGVFLEANQIEKAMRWLGFIQGAMWYADIRSVEEMRQDNKPEPNHPGLVGEY